MKKPLMIAFDGPSASGKSTLAEKLAENLSYLYFDTGVMYRAVTYASIQRKIPAEKEKEISELSAKITIDVNPASKKDGRKNDILLEGQDITWEISKPEVEALVSLVSSYALVRQEMTEQQRRIGKRGRVVMVGRDIGTVVLPEADLKIYLDASVEERAKRRYEERIRRGEKIEYQQVLEGMQKRDLLDSSRKIAPLQAAKDAIVIQSDGFSSEEILKKVISIIEE